MTGSKNWYIYIMEYYTVERKKELLPFMTAWTELESIMRSEIHQSVKGKYLPYKSNVSLKKKKVMFLGFSSVHCSVQGTHCLHQISGPSGGILPLLKKDFGDRS